jgi:hypothetical protein
MATHHQAIDATEGIITYDDGSCYIGGIKNGKKHGKGVLSTLAFVYTPFVRANSENAHLAKWNEYHGTWVDDKMHGCGQMIRRCAANSDKLVLFDGMWENGQQIESTATSTITDK